eukprot:gnl/Trimastix_PCT/1628.p2 GENE.gnl/Trimastix_PCT/1628~~gnl/Trimastix_PCT/1628.p2  ORF type:complete len:143 (+),score=17.15 gnl/Trimastix_PCT/1628:34-429(+)
MRLLSHNMLQCIVPECTNRYPLAIQDAVVEPIEYERDEDEEEFDAEFVQRMIPRIDYAVLVATARSIGINEPALPDTLPDSWAADEPFLRTVHSILQEMEIVSGRLVCPGCGRVYPINEAIPNMILRNDEV